MLIAEMAAGVEILKGSQCELISSGSVSFRQCVAVKAVVAEVLGTAPGSITYNAGQVFGGTGYSEDDTLSKLYRDAAAWRFLGVPNSAVYARHGAALLEAWTANGDVLQRLPEEQALFA